MAKRTVEPGQRYHASVSRTRASQRSRDLTDRKTLAGALMDRDVPLIAAEIPRLRRYARALLRDDERADDLVQETLLRGLDKLHLYRSGTDLRAWLFTMMHNQYVNHVRRWVRQRETIVIDKIQLACPAAQQANLELRDVERAIQRLSDEYRITLLLIALEGMKYDEVAQICNIPVGTVRSRLSRARRELRQMIEARDPPGRATIRGTQTASKSATETIR